MATILIADDEPDVRAMLAAALDAAGYGTMEAANGLEVLARASEHPPDLVLLDLGMPQMDGLAVLRALRLTANAKSIPVIVLSKSGDKRSVAAAARFSVKAYLVKRAFNTETLLERVREALSTGNFTPNDSPEEVASTHSANTELSTLATKGHAATATAANQRDAAATLLHMPPIMTCAQVFAAVKGASQLRGFAPAVQDVLNLTSRDDCSIDVIADAIGRDPALTLKVLQLANSALFTTGKPVYAVHDAVLRIGIGEIRRVAMTIGFVDHFASNASKAGIDPIRLWEHSIATAIIAAELARALGDSMTGKYFTLGLLHDLGRLILVHEIADAYHRVVETAKKLCLPLETVEQHLLGATHASVIEIFVQRWSSMQSFTNPIALHHSPDFKAEHATGSDANRLAILQLADRLAHAYMLGSSGNDVIYPTRELCIHLTISDSTIAGIGRSIRDATRNATLAMLSQSPMGALGAISDSYRLQLRSAVRPVFAGSGWECDATKILCQSLMTDPPAHACPIVVAYQGGCDWNAILREVEQIERANGLKSSPVLVIQPIPKPESEWPANDHRTIAALTMPFTIDRFIQTINAIVG